MELIKASTNKMLKLLMECRPDEVFLAYQKAVNKLKLKILKISSN